MIYYGPLQEDITELAALMRHDSERWFPQIHDGHLDLGVFYALGMCGEVGEVANLVKKIIRKDGADVAVYPGLAEELADVLTYLLLLAAEMNVDIISEYVKKRERNEGRWGER